MSVILDKPRSLYECVEQLLNIELQNFKGGNLKNNTFYEIQHSLINKLEELFNQQCVLNLQPITVTYIVKELMLNLTFKTSFQNIIVSENEQMRTLVESMFVEQVKLENVPTKDLEVIVKMLQGATFQNKLERELAKRM